MESKIENLQVLFSYKVKQCPKQNCLYKDDIYGKKKCSKYHSDKDRRRFVFDVSNTLLQSKKDLLEKLQLNPTYHEGNLIEDIIKNFPSIFPEGKMKLIYTSIQSELFQDDEKYSQNEIEYLYHPFNFKKQPCKDGSRCQHQYCPYYHSITQQKNYKYLRSFCLDNQDTFFQKFLIASQNIEMVVDDLENVNKKLQNIDNNCEEIEQVDESFDADDIVEQLIPNENQNTIKSQPMSPERNKKSRKQNTERKSKPNNKIFFNDLKNNLYNNEDKNQQTKKQKDSSQNKKSKSPMNRSQQSDQRAKSGNRQSKQISYYAMKKTTFKKGKFICLPNINKSSQFIYNKEVNLYENINTEFKHLNMIDYQLIFNYICGFLNSVGGRIFFGINDEGIVKGMQLKRKEIDNYLIRQDIALRNFRPRVFPNQVDVKIHEVVYDERQTYVIQDRYILEITVTCCQYQNVYVTDQFQCYIKKHGSLNHLSLNEVVQFVQEKQNAFLKTNMKQELLNKQLIQIMADDELQDTHKNLSKFMKDLEEEISRRKNIQIKFY